MDSVINSSTQTGLFTHSPRHLAPCPSTNQPLAPTEHAQRWCHLAHVLSSPLFSNLAFGVIQIQPSLHVFFTVFKRPLPHTPLCLFCHYYFSCGNYCHYCKRMRPQLNRVPLSVILFMVVFPLCFFAFCCLLPQPPVCLCLNLLLYFQGKHSDCLPVFVHYSKTFSTLN